MWRPLLTIQRHYNLQCHLPWTPQSSRQRLVNLHSLVSANKEQLNAQAAPWLLLISESCYGFSQESCVTDTYHSVDLPGLLLQAGLRVSNAGLQG